eukprot:gb/GEZN01005073.1/.p1 GENE.gb/GEZN01005073.1/~~gb/GEZN01005073.1/.p1  ORF type:complete len:332 (-),score=56.91 gb/GEZN01005073.1/:832-1827(-)
MLNAAPVEVLPDPAFLPLLDHLTRIKLNSVHPRAKDRSTTLWKSAVTIKGDETLLSAFKKFADNHILSMPVVDDEGHLVGQLSMGHLLKWMCEQLGITDGTTPPRTGSFEKALGITKVFSVCDTHGIGYFAVRDCYSVYTAAETMARRNAKRVIVTNTDHKVVGIFTQSMLIGELYNNMQLLSMETRQIKVRQMTKSFWLSTLREDSLTIDAFRNLYKWGRNAIAIVSPSGQIVDGMCEKDLKAVVASGQNFQYPTIKEYKAYVRNDAEEKGKRIPDAQLVTEETTFEDVVRIMDQTPCDYVFVTDRTKRPLYVISQTDVLRFIFPPFGWW